MLSKANSYRKCILVVKSSKTKEQLESSSKMVDLFSKLYSCKEDDEFLKFLKFDIFHQSKKIRI